MKANSVTGACTLLRTIRHGGGTGLRPARGLNRKGPLFLQQTDQQTMCTPHRARVVHLESPSPDRSVVEGGVRKELTGRTSGLDLFTQETRGWREKSSPSSECPPIPPGVDGWNGLGGSRSEISILAATPTPLNRAPANAGECKVLSYYFPHFSKTTSHTHRAAAPGEETGTLG